MTNTIATTDERTEAHVPDSRIYPNGRWQHAAFQASDFTAPEDFFDDARRIVYAAVAILAQGEDLLRALSADLYTRRVPLAFNACIGGHYRLQVLRIAALEAQGNDPLDQFKIEDVLGRIA